MMDDMLDERCVLDLEYDRINVRAIIGRQFDWISLVWRNGTRGNGWRLFGGGGKGAKKIR